MYSIYLSSLTYFSVLLVITILTACGGGDSDSNTRSVTKAKVTLSSKFPAIDNSFGRPLVFSPDGNSIAISSLNGDTENAKNTGSVEIFKKTNSGWQNIQYITNEIPTYGSYFGYLLAFSPDGLVLAIGQKYSSAVHLYTKLNSKWLYSETIYLIAPYRGDYLGDSIVFSPDSKTLVMSASRAIVDGGVAKGVVQLFDYRNSRWSWTQTINSTNSGAGFQFGDPLLFSPDGRTLVIGEIQFISPEQLISSALHLFNKRNGVWTLSTKIPSPKPGLNSSFQNTKVVFGRNNEMIITAEPGATLNGDLNTGIVQVFTLSGNKWQIEQIIESKNPGKGFRFGLSLSLSADGNTLAISELAKNAEGQVHLLTRTVKKWRYMKTIVAKVPYFSGSFGFSINFNPINNELAISELNNKLMKYFNSGSVTIIDVDQLP